MCAQYANNMYNQNEINHKIPSGFDLSKWMKGLVKMIQDIKREYQKMHNVGVKQRGRDKPPPLTFSYQAVHLHWIQWAQVDETEKNPPGGD